MDEMIFDTTPVDHPLFYIPAAACCLLFCGVWLTTLWQERCKRSEPTLPRFAPLTPMPECDPKPSILIDKNLTFVMDLPPQTPPPARFRGAGHPNVS